MYDQEDLPSCGEEDSRKLDEVYCWLKLGVVVVGGLRLLVRGACGAEQGRGGM